MVVALEMRAREEGTTKTAIVERALERELAMVDAEQETLAGAKERIEKSEAFERRVAQLMDEGDLPMAEAKHLAKKELGL